MIDFSRTFCDLHPNELISNFCCREECNVGLCATCICSHTETHIQKRTAPYYENIRTTYSKMQENIRTRIQALQQEKNRINLLIENIQSKRKITTDTISQAKQETLDFVNRYFEAKEKEILRKVEADEKKLGLHNENRMDTLNNLISRDINNLFAAAQDLNSANFLESFHRIRTQVLANSLQTQLEISDQLDKNQNYEACLSINPIFINQIKAGLEKSLMFCWEEKKLGQRMFEVKDTRQTNNRSSRTIINPNENSGALIGQKRAESMPKQSFVNHPSRGSSIVQPFSGAFMKQSAQFQSQQAQFQPQPIQLQSQSAQFQPQSTQFQLQSSQFQPQPAQFQPQSQPIRYKNESYIVKNSYNPAMQARPVVNNNSRAELRMNSSQKNIKQNGFTRHPLTQSYMDISYATSGQLEGSKKIRKSGLTVLRPVDNQSKA